MGPEWVRAVADLVAALAWPAVAVVMVVKYRSNVGRLIDRLRKGGPAEFDPLPLPQSGAPESSAGALAPGAGGGVEVAAFRTEATRQVERLVREFPMVAGTTDPAARAEVLVTIAARVILMARFESTEAYIWASQVALLDYLNSQPAGVASEVLRGAYYDEGVRRHPQIYQNYTFEQYMGFLERAGFVESMDSGWRLTAAGHESLEWRVGQRKPPRVAG